MLEFNATVFIQLINVVILFVVIKFLLLKPAMEAIESRRRAISGHIDDAEKAKEEAVALKVSYKDKLSRIEAEGDKILKQFKTEGERLKEEHIKDGRDKAQKLVQSATGEIEAKKQQVVQEVKTMSADLAVTISERLLKGFLDKDAQQDISKRLAQKVKEYHVG
jgi:F-type H+-transporting ATPase subunit b